MNKDAAKKVLFEIVDIFGAYDINLILHCGTLIGAYRGDFQEGDEDLDFAVKHEEIVPKIKLLKESLHAHGYGMMVHSNPYLYERGLKIAKVVEGNTIHADIIDYALNGKHRFHQHYKIDYASVHDADFFENLQTVKFLGRDFIVPCRVEEFLESIYGKDWRTPKVKVDFPEDYKNIVVNYWDKTIYSKATEIFHKRRETAWQAYKIEIGVALKASGNE